MSHSIIRPVILCGGSGKRLWPASRKSLPKQFTRLTGQESMLQATVRRLEDCGCAAPIIMTGQDYRFVVGEQMDDINAQGHRIVIEPEGRNTGPAILAAAEIAFAEDPDVLLFVAPSDHLVHDVMALSRAIAAAADRARAGEIVTFGIRPHRPETGYGYIEISDPDTADALPQPFVRFVEKPDLAAAEAMLAAGTYLWNAGMFLFSAKTVRAAFERHQPQMCTAVRGAVAEARTDLDFLRLGETYSTAPDISIDYAILEHETGSVVAMSAGWNDMGTWRSVWQESDLDAYGVATSGHALAMQCQDTLLKSYDDNMQIVGIGLKNIAAIATADAILIVDLDSTQDVNKAVAAIALEGAVQAEQFPKHMRPWGHYETLSLGSRYQVKSIVVRPGGQLSLQSHVHRSEHWVVVEGTAMVTIGQDEQLLGENQSVYIPVGEVHRLSNPGKFNLRLIEVQTGAYLGEDDIVRYEDIYARA